MDCLGCSDGQRTGARYIYTPFRQRALVSLARAGSHAQTLPLSKDYASSKTDSHKRIHFD